MVARITAFNSDISPASGSRRSGSQQVILDTAAKLFRQRGYASVSLRDVASKCGMKAGSLYYHFKSKDEIVSEVLRIGVYRTFEQVKASVEALPPNATSRQLLGAAILTHLQAILERQDYASANVRIFGQVPAHIRAAHAGLREAYESYWDGILTLCVKRQHGKRTTSEIHAARSFLIGAMNATLEWFDPEGSPIEQLAAELADIFLGGVSSEWSTSPESAPQEVSLGY
ncbi:MAG TPA: TetR/AcrR family transcriptional regulator [Nevskiaceae bacterium]|nr:TetR/AcrR family transcriptional regulator [Nevskiaceae bacterium]